MNGSGLLILNPPWQLDQSLAGVLPLLSKELGEGPGAASRLEWLVRAA
jgi:23S rRNA (adenine2030-N6)-methyltransferase